MAGFTKDSKMAAAHEGRAHFKPSLPLLRLILAKAALGDCAGWSYQGFGMYRLYLGHRDRLHIWMPDDARDNVSTIHNHPWDFESKILVGSLVNRVFTRMNHETPLSHMMQRIVCGPGGGAIPNSEQYISLRVRSERIYTTGDTYTMEADDLHETVVTTSGTVTMIHRHFKENTEHATVCYPIGTKWVSAEPRDATVEEVVRAANTALKLVDEELASTR